MTIIEALVELGRYEEAEELARPVLSGSQNTPGAMWVVQSIARAMIAQGRFDEARRQMDRVRPVQGLIVNDIWQSEMACDMAMAQGDFEGVESAVEQAIAVASDETRAAAWLCLATGIGAAADQAVAATGRRRPGEAAHAVDRAHRWLGLLREIVGAAEADEGAGPFWIAALTTAEAEATRCDGAADSDLWADAVDRWAALSHPLYQGRAQLRHAEAILASGGARGDAEAALRQAHATAVRIGAVPLRLQLEAVAGRARLDIGVAAAVAVSGEAESSAPSVVLTPRELAVLRLVADGHTNREVGDQLFISEKTVSVHVSNAMAKLGALSRYEAAASAERLGLLA
jgi:DNA-binding CsgD family transcriptional regulator